MESSERSGYSAPGFAARYDANRPRPPEVLLELVPRLAGVERPALVVDLGSGSGLSTRFWAPAAAAVVGVEPNDEMRRFAESVTHDGNVSYVGASAYDTGLAAGSADIVTCSQSLQWMDPELVFPEIGRILRPGGVFAAYQYTSLASGGWEADAAWAELRAVVRRRRTELGLDSDRQRWPVSRQRLVDSGVFRFTIETTAHSAETGDGERFIGFVLSEGSLSTLLERVTEEEIGLDRLRELAARTLGADPAPWHIGYQVWVGVR
jgi:SAM-dependent methyltransferase